MAVLPVSQTYTVTATYGQSGKYWRDGHKGIDFVTSGREVYSTTDGVVRVSLYDPSGWGNYLSIGDSRGLRHIYCHLEKKTVAAGDTVKAGQLIGIMGSSGNATGVHLHYQINTADGVAQNPAEFLSIENAVGTFTQKVGEQNMYLDDSKISGFARDAVYELKERGIMVGDKEGYFNPKAPLSREEAAVLISKLLKEN